MAPTDMNAIYRCPVHDEPGSLSETYGRVFADVYDDWYAHVTNVDETVDTLVRLAGGGDLLELGVGTGRIAVPLALRLGTGARIVGVDESEEMLTIWRMKLGDLPRAAKRSEVVRGDMSAPLPAGPFAVVFCTFNTFFNLPDHEAQRACLKHAAAVLARVERLFWSSRCFRKTTTSPPVSSSRNGDDPTGRLS